MNSLRLQSFTQNCTLVILLHPLPVTTLPFLPLSEAATILALITVSYFCLFLNIV